MREYLHSFAKLEFDKVITRLTSLAATDLGKSKIQAIKPCSSLDEIQTALKCVTEMKYLLESDTPPSFEGIVDCRVSIHHACITDSILSAPELRQIANLLTAARRLKGYFQKRSNFVSLLASLCAKIEIDKILEFNIDNAISEQGEVRDNASKQLTQIRTTILKLRERLKNQLESILHRVVKNGWAQEEIITTREGRMVIPVKVEHKHQIPGFIHSTSSSGATVFIEPAETLEMNNEIRSLLFDEEREIQHILKDLTSQVKSKADELLNTVQILENLDVIYAKARYSIAINGAELKIQSNIPFSLIEVRHPLLLEQQAYNRVVPLNIELGKEFQTVLISGPNAGGKSVALKTVGLISVMVHHGMHAPASPDSHIPVIDSIFVDIGDEQSIENNLSTFTSHLNKLKLICDNANSSSLVLIDEICAGTDPSEGGALAAAILKKLTDQKCFTIATTHISFLKAFATNTKAIINASMEFNQDTLMPTYKLRVGKLGSSYALEIAQRLELSEELIFQAKKILGVEAQRLSELIADLEKERNKFELEREVLNNKEKYINKLIEEYELKLSALKTEIIELKRKALKEAKEIVEESNSLVEQSIRDIREHNGERPTIRKVKEQLKQHASNVQYLLQEIEHDNNSSNTDFSVGDLVKFKGGNEIGEVLDIVDRNNVIIFSRNLKIKVEKDKLSHVDSKSFKAIKLDNLPIAVVPKHKVDIRGMVGDDAIGIVDKCIDDAILSGLKQIEIIHGKGSGSLRKRIHNFLSSHSQVKSYRLGEWNEGGLGVTIVELL